jgi:hypothetical protein
MWYSFVFKEVNMSIIPPQGAKWTDVFGWVELGHHYIEGKHKFKPAQYFDAKEKNYNDFNNYANIVGYFLRECLQIKNQFASLS